MPQRKSQRTETFGDLNPWAEPAWYNVLSSPYYNDSHRKLRRFVRDYMNENVLDFAEEWEEKGEVPREETIKFARAGLAFQNIPAKYRPGVSLPAGISEEDWDPFHDLVLQDERARVESGVLAGLSTASGIGAPPIVKFGTEKQKDAWLPGVFTGQTVFCLGATEPTGGSDLANLKTTAVKSECGKYYIVNGYKKWITGVMTSTHMTTAVRTGGPGAAGVSVLVIPTNSSGFSTKKIKNTGANAGGSAWVTLENVQVPVENLIGTENRGFQVLMSNFNKERFSIAVTMNRKTRTCLSVAFAYAHERVTFGQPLIANQVIRAKFANIAKDVESHWAWLEQLAYHVKVNGWTDDLASRLALAKVQGGRMLELANREAQQVLGGAGYQQGGVGSSVEQIGRDLRMLVVGGGSEEIISDLAVRQELNLSRRIGAKI
ncbi:acyl-CoA dehydrogenase NM domain-like protein [Mytilinidion resinicola]|uniref:Acyl-CoA dehydrogenase NM domain-like protein n=1 Tax=Mytilinidion resinicola TaxID=574789 RepID=A0A6A6ZAA6_9PEZI|nr:acyl-CoA dehydrogenase NM domain-like protein [Mytilinidion resinicola]KAF2817629.1 acyl-CoA dehydrogenase NM domain-like protein [Mytilinidion resinicola]